VVSQADVNGCDGLSGEIASLGLRQQLSEYLPGLGPVARCGLGYAETLNKIGIVPRKLKPGTKLGDGFLIHPLC